MRRLSARLAPLAALVTGVGVAAFAVAPAASADTITTTYSFTGSEQTFSVPAGVSQVHVLAVGGRGGANLDGIAGGSGAVVSADLTVTPGGTLYLEVGGNGGDATASTAAGGYNGGGASGFDAGGGGGASDVRTASSASAGSLGTRLLVAGGGGGSAQLASSGGSSAQNGTDGSLVDTTTCPLSGKPGAGATHDQGGAGGAGDLFFGGSGRGGAGGSGVGGHGGVETTITQGGGGGAGYFGGGGGGAGPLCAGAGGGGSSSVSGTSPSYGTDTSGTPLITISYDLPGPQATTEPASSTTATGAILNGVVDPEGSQTSYQFEYGTTDAYGSLIPAAPGDVGSDTAQHSVSAAVAGLTPGTTYHFRVVATNGSGSADGGDLSFTTAASAPQPAPQAATNPATGVGKTQATLNGTVDPEGSSTTYHFVYGTTTRYGRSTPAQGAGSGVTNVSVHALLSGLARHTTYHFRLVAVNRNGTTNGVDRTLRTG
jgi:hypothetical protein